MDPNEFLKQLNEKEEEALKSVQVDKKLYQLDLGHLLLLDRDGVDEKKFRSTNYLKQLATENVQFVINKLCDLETKVENALVLTKLPTPELILPRFKPIPKPKPPTKWETFAKAKGIRNRKKEKLVWDEASNSWKPRYGYRSINSTNDQWMIEVPDNKDDDTDMFEEMNVAKKERIAKNELQRLRNIARQHKAVFKGKSRK